MEEHGSLTIPGKERDRRGPWKGNTLDRGSLAFTRFSKGILKDRFTTLQRNCLR
jgi:hypothetical protein